MNNILKKFFVSIEIVSVVIIILGFVGLMFKEWIDRPHLLIPIFYIIYIILSLGSIYLFNKYLPRFKDKKIVNIGVILVICLPIRMITMYYLNLDQQGDYGIYLSTAYKLYSHQTINYLYYGIFPHAINYPIFLSIIYDLFSYSLRAVKLVHLFFAGIEMIFIYLIISKFIGQQKALYLSLIVIMNPVYIFSVLFTGGESIYSSLIMVAIYLIVILYKEQINQEVQAMWLQLLLKSLMLGIAISLAEFFRPTAIILLIALLIVEILFRKEKILIRLIRFLSVFIVYLILSISFANIIASVTTYEKPSKCFGWNLFIGGNYESEGTWNTDDGELFKQVYTKSDNPSEIQEYFYQLAIDRYTDLMKTGKITLHFIKKLVVWHRNSYITINVCNWQTDVTRYASQFAFEVIDLICYITETGFFMLMLLLMILRRWFKDKNHILDITGLYILGLIFFHLIMESSTRYKIAYYNVIALYVVLTTYILYKQWKINK